eukprot:CAMPEP_0170174202 /NCGR_PEP_ID=MMETSP0040_2-20121228/7444_1 /TAXON_ID=641309 /ORGANISM="Lotharella oceanica, Strain CCMP622" /LENGTH=290 /DNA_ID=CAMNT_0010415733 /DNA_START=6 /DNA_END=878 /DNA_ORIENTATION=+
MADALGYPFSDHTFEDMYLQGQVGETYYNQHIAHRVSGIQLKKLTGMKLKRLGTWLTAFRNLDQLVEAPLEVERLIQKPSAVPTDSPKLHQVQSSHDDILGKRPGADARRPKEELTVVAGPGLLNRMYFLALAQGLTSKSLSVADEVFDIVSKGGVVDVIGAATGFGILLDVLPAENQVRIAFEWDEKGSVHKSKARAVMSALEEKKTSDNVLDTLYKGKEAVNINDIVRAAKTSPAITKAAHARIEQQLPSRKASSEQKEAPRFGESTLAHLKDMQKAAGLTKKDGLSV